MKILQKTSDPLFSSAEDPHEWDGSIRLCVDVVVLILVKLAELVRFDQLHRLALVSRVFRAALRRPDVCWRNRWSHWRLQELIPNLMRAEIGMCFASNSRVANWGVPIPITLSELMAGKPVEKDVSVLCVNGAICVSKQAGTMKVERSGVLLCSFDIPSTDCFISSAVASDQDQMIAWLLETPRGIALFCTRFGTAPFVVVKKHAGVFSSFVLLGIGEGFVFVESDSTLRGYEARPGGAVKYSHPLVTRQNWRDRSVVTFLYGSWFCLLRTLSCSYTFWNIQTGEREKLLSSSGKPRSARPPLVVNLPTGVCILLDIATDRVLSFWSCQSMRFLGEVAVDFEWSECTHWQVLSNFSGLAVQTNRGLVVVPFLHNMSV